VGEHCLHVGPVGERRQARGLGHKVDRERRAGAVKEVDHLGGRVAPADPQAGQAEDLGEGPGHHHVIALRHQGRAGLVVVGGGVLFVGRVDDQQDSGRKLVPQPPYFRAREVGPRGIVGIGDDDHFGAVGDAAQDAVHRVAEVVVGRGHRMGTRRCGIDRELHIGVGAVDHLVARPGIGLHQAGQQIVGAGAKGDAPRLEAEAHGERLLEALHVHLRVAVHVFEHLAGGLQRARARAQRRLVGRQLEDPIEARQLGDPHHIVVDVPQAGTRRGSGHGISLPRVPPKPPEGGHSANCDHTC
jgi:hypothetical protein